MAYEENRRAIRRAIEQGLGSRGRIRILGVLGARPTDFFTRYALGTATGIRSGYVRADLKALVELGWVEELKYKPMKYKVNSQHEIVREVMGFLKKVGYF